MILNKEKSIFIFMTIIIRLSMDFLFVEYITDKWSYQGFIVELNPTKIIISYIILILLLIMLSQYQKNKMSHFFVMIFLYTMYMPLGVLYGYMNTSNQFFWIATTSFYLLVFIVIFLNRYKKKQKKTITTEDNVIVTKLFWILIIISFYTFVAMTIQNIGNIDIASVINFADVYSVRETARYGLGMNYFYSWQTKVINPYLITYGQINNKKTLRNVIILFQVWLYILTGQKMIIFTLFIILIIQNFLKKFSDLHLFFTKGLFISNILAVTEVILFNDSVLVDNILRRVMYVPALLNNYYYDFFSEYGFQYWSHTLFGRILNLKTDFEIPPSYVIGAIYFNNSDTNAVTGYLGSEYMNGGIVGVFIATLIIILILILIDRLTLKVGPELILITLTTPIYNLWNTSLTTTLLTGGLLLGILILYYTKRDFDKIKL